MNNFKSIFTNENVVEAYKLISEYNVWVEHTEIGPHNIGIKIYKDISNSYSYKLSHHYQGSEQAGPYVSSRSGGFQDEEAALEGAKREMFSFYKSDDAGARWVESSVY